jgi:hypothetical protein
MMPESLPSYSGFASGAAGQAYNQTAFRHFLAIERRRAERSGRPLLLVLVALRGTQSDNTLAGATAAAIFRGLGETVREVDFVGWFREGMVAGAVLTQGATAVEPTKSMVADRITRVLRTHLPAALGRRVRVRVVRFDPRTVADSQTPTALASGH